MVVVRHEALPSCDHGDFVSFAGCGARVEEHSALHTTGKTSKTSWMRRVLDFELASFGAFGN